jgi:uncharacterized surface protein with fasciclin (FAS1) repeats
MIRSLSQKLPLWILAAWVACSILIVGCGDSAEEPPASSDSETVLADSTTIASVLRTDDRFTTLVTAIDSAGLDSTLASGGPYTLLAPTNDAFDKLPEGTLPDLLDRENRERLRTILRHHLIPQKIRSEDASDRTTVTTLEGTPLPVSADDQTVRIGGATVLDADIVTGNGVIHVVDAVLRPPVAEEE